MTIQSAAELLGEGFTCSHCGGTEFEKERDILDVWFDSGSTHAYTLGDPEHFPSLSGVKRKVGSRSVPVERVA